MIYLDNAATTPCFPEAAEEAALCMTKGYWNPSAGYAQGLAAEKAMDETRALIKSLVGGTKVVFTSGGTEANNLALRGTMRKLRSKGHMISTAMEHPSVLYTLRALEKEGHELTLLRVENGQVDLDQLRNAIRPNTALLSLMQTNNETGAMADIGACAQLAKSLSPQITVHCDGVQGFGKLPFSLDETGIDLYTLSGHKLHAPKGIGALVLRKGAHVEPLHTGGGQENDIRSGTENTPGIAGLYAALGLWAKNGPAYRAKTEALRRQLADGLLAGIGDIVVNSPAGGAHHILNISFLGVRVETLQHALEEEQILTGVGSACSARRAKGLSEGLLAQGLSPQRAESALRFSFSPLNTPDEIHQTLEAVTRQVARLRQFRRK